MLYMQNDASHGKNGVMCRQKKNDMIGENDGGGRKKNRADLLVSEQTLTATRG